MAPSPQDRAPPPRDSSPDRSHREPYPPRERSRRRRAPAKLRMRTRTVSSEALSTQLRRERPGTPRVVKLAPEGAKGCARWDTGRRQTTEPAASAESAEIPVFRRIRMDLR